MQIQEKSIKYIALLCTLLLLISTFLLNNKNKECQALKEDIYINSANYHTLQKMLYRNLKAMTNSDNFSLNQNLILYR